MKISIITPTFNSAKTLEQTIKNVLSQKDIDLEYIIIDGGSTDGTLDIIDKYRNRLAHVVSEKDRGIYDAMNKGVAAATGEVIGIINSDDFYYDDQTLGRVVGCFGDSSVEACYGDLIYVDKDDVKKIVRRWKAGNYNPKKLMNGWIPPHPTFFCRRSVYDRCGLYRTDMRLAADYEFMLRCFKINNIQPHYLAKPIAYMRNEGASSNSFASRRRGWEELKKGWTVNRLSTPKFFILRRIIFKLPQFFHR